jgi:HEAT repeat protein
LPKRGRGTPIHGGAVAGNQLGDSLSDSEITQAGTGDALPEAYSRNAVLFIVNAHAATVNMRLYPPTSSMVTETFDKAREGLDVIFAGSDVISIATIENSLMVNDVRLSDVEQAKAPIKSFVQWMNERGLSIIEFRKGVEGEELQTFFTILSEMSDVSDRAKLTDELKEQGVDNITVNQRVYVAVTTSDTGEIIGGVQGSSAPLDALKDELLMRYLMGKVDLGTVEDRELVDVLSDAGKVGGLLSRFLGEEGNEGGVLMKSLKAEEALSSLAEMVNEIDDEKLRDTMGDQITRVIVEMSPREMTSVLSGHAPETLNIRHVRENVITMLSDNQLLDMIDSLIDEYVEMKGEATELDTEWTKQRLRDLNELLTGVRDDRGDLISEAIDKKLDEAGIEEERDPHTGTRLLSAYQMLGGPLEEEDLDLGEGVDQTVPRQIRQLYAMEESDLAAGMLLKMVENLRQDSPAVRRFAAKLIKETLDGLDDEHALQAVDVIRPRLVEDLEREDDYEAFTLEMDAAARMAELFMKSGRTEESSVMIELLMTQSSEDSGKGEELVKFATEVMGDLMGPDGMIDVEALLLEEDDDKRARTVQALASLGPTALAPLVDMVKDRGQIELRDRALEAIKFAGEPGYQALLGELEKENPWYIYRNILNVVADLRLEMGLPQVTAMTTNPDERIRREAVRSLARIGSKDSIDAVKNAANDPSSAVRRTAVRVLGMFGDPAVAPFLLDMIKAQGPRGKEEDQGVTESACLALGDLKDSAYIPQLAELLGKGGLFKKSQPDEIRAAACIALGSLGDPAAVPVLERVAKDQSVMVRSSAEKSLRRLKGDVTAPEPMAVEEIAPAPLVEAPPPELPAPVLKAEAPPAVEQAPVVEAPIEQPAQPVEPPALEESPALEPAPAEDQPAFEQPPRENAVETQPFEQPELPIEPAPFGQRQAPGTLVEAGAQQYEQAPAAEAPLEPAAPPFEQIPPPEQVVPQETVQQEQVPQEPLAEPPDTSSLEYIIKEQGSFTPVGEQEEFPPPQVAEGEKPGEQPIDSSSLEYILTEQAESGQPVEQQPDVPVAPLPEEEPPAGEHFDPTTLEGMLLAGEAPEQTLELPDGPQDVGPGKGPSTMETLVDENREDAIEQPARLTVEPPDEVAGLPGHTEPTAAQVPAELADLWPEGSLNGHDYPVPPPPALKAETGTDTDITGNPATGDSFLRGPQAPEEEQPVEGLPESEDYAAGRIDQPSTMERMLGPGEAPTAPPEGGQPPEPDTPSPNPPPPPPAPSGWK